VLKRHSLFMIFQALMPAVTLTIFFACIGGSMQNLTVAVFNGEDCSMDGKHNWTCPDLDRVPMDASCQVLRQIDPDTYDIREETSEDAAYERVRAGDAHAVAVFRRGFSGALAKRTAAMLSSQVPDASVLRLSEVHVSLDASNVEVARTVSLSIIQAVQVSLANYLKACNLEQLAEVLTDNGLNVMSVQDEFIGVEDSPLDNKLNQDMVNCNNNIEMPETLA